MHHHKSVVVVSVVVLASAAMLALKSVTAYATAPQSRAEAPAFFRLMLGDYEVTVLWDGTAAREMDRIMSKPAVVRGLYVRDHQALPVAMSLNTFLINTGSKLVLIDSGGGRFVGERAGRLIANLRASGYQPEQVDAVLLTHMHPDHFGGLVDEGRRTFPNALIYVNKRDLDYWLSAAAEEMPARQTMSQQAHAAVGPYAAAGVLRPFDGVTALFPGIRALPAPGHTVGHTTYMIESRGKQLLLWGDIIHSAETQFLDPQIAIQFDMNVDDAIAARERLLADAARNGYIVGSAHITFPGLGHVSSDGQVYSWVQLPYAAP
jgi:Zn-dependent hydrolases, including glyoxylases